MIQKIRKNDIECSKIVIEWKNLHFIKKTV